MKRKCICDDCSVDIVKAGEYVMLSPKIWEDELGLAWGDNLCIGCVEERRGGRRIIGFGDICNMQKVGPSPSTRLLVRVYGGLITKRKPYRLRAGTNIVGITRKMAAAIGEARDAGV